MIRQTIISAAQGLVIAAILSQGAMALDYGHTEVNNIDCISCHDIFTPGEAGKYFRLQNPVGSEHIDDTEANNLCWSCHNELLAPFAEPHSSRMISEKYGQWAMECIDCHNPHWQSQFRPDPETMLASGEIDEITETSITDYDANWLVDEFAGLVVFTRWDRIVDGSQTTMRSYRILGNTEDTLTVDLGSSGAGINLAKAEVGDLFAVAYGKLIKYRVDTPNSGIMNVNFYSPDGDNSFADGDEAADGICEVCHTLTGHWSLAALAVEDVHYPAQKCTSCHDHVSGFKPSCDACHGTPPVVDVVRAKDGIVAAPAPTGSDSAGAHDLHVNQYGFVCATCHYNGMPATPIVGNQLLQIGFSGPAINGAIDGAGTTYGGRASLSLPYGYEGTNETTVSADDSLTCSGVYCHSDGRSVSTGNAPAGVSPTWDGSQNDPQEDGNKCNNCHGYPPRYDSHNYHIVRGITCKLCHFNTTRDNTSIFGDAHMNGIYDLVASPTFYQTGSDRTNGFIFTPAVQASGFGGTCSNNLCHQFNVYKDPKTWGKATVLTNAPPISSQMFSQGDGFSLLLTDRSTDADYNSAAQSHSATTPGKIKIDWGDGAVELFDLPMTNIAKDRYFSHVYSSAGIRNISVKIKDNDPDSVFVSSPIKTYEIIDYSTQGCIGCHALPPTTGSHALHVASYNYDCKNCHNGGMPVRNQDGSIDAGASAANSLVGIGFQFLVWDGSGTVYNGNSSTAAYQAFNNTTVNAAVGGPQTCDNTYCHSNGRAIGSGGSINANTAPRWDGSGASLVCTSCHNVAALPYPDAHSRHINVRGYTCDFCHYQVAANGTAISDSSKHANGEYNVNASPAAQFRKGTLWYNFSFDYAYKDGGGVCNNNTCHSTWLLNKPDWRR